MSNYERDTILLEQIIESVELISQYTQMLDLEDFLDQRQIQDAVLRRLQIIGEAAKGGERIPQDILSGYSLERNGGNARCGCSPILVRGSIPDMEYGNRNAP